MHKALKILLFLVVIIGSFSLLLYYPPASSRLDGIRSSIMQYFYPKQVWMNIFVHGTVGSSLAFLDFNAVQQDQLQKTLYKKAVATLRKTSFFYQEQPINQKGLVPIHPSFDYTLGSDNNSGASPISKSFDIVDALTSQAQPADNFNYTFGWSGLLSQTYRRLEALRFYNELGVELKRLKAEGVVPKIRIIAHSHGGNVALNLAGAWHAVQNDAEYFAQFQAGKYVQEVWQQLVNNLPEQDQSQQNKGHKRWDFKPSTSAMHIDELVLLGTPIQYETSLFAYSPLFKKVYHIYSDEDAVQDVDFATSIKKISYKKFVASDILQPGVMVEPPKQIRILICQTLDEQAKQSKDPEYQDSAWWKVVFGFKQAGRKSLNPTHKELWFLVSKNLGDAASFVRPLPMVAFVPAITKAANMLEPDHIDQEFFVGDDNNLYIRAFPHKDKGLLSKNICLPYSELESVKQSLEPWESTPERQERAKEITKEAVKQSLSVWQKNAQS